MDKNKIIRLTNSISLISIFLLLYWVFTFISIQVFGFKVFRENLTESFYFSILGILSLLTGGVIVNVMFNLTKISEVMSGEYEKGLSKTLKKRKILFWSFLISFPLLFALLYFGDIRSAEVKEQHLVSAAEYIAENNKDLTQKFSHFELDSTYLSELSSLLTILSRENESFPQISVIHEIEEKGRNLFINIGSHFYWNKNESIINHIHSCSAEERSYLENVFHEGENFHRFSSSDGNYELYYPIKSKGNIFVLYCTDFQRYGKFGS